MFNRLFETRNYWLAMLNAGALETHEDTKFLNLFESIGNHGNNKRGKMLFGQDPTTKNLLATASRETKEERNLSLNDPCKISGIFGKRY